MKVRDLGWSSHVRMKLYITTTTEILRQQDHKNNKKSCKLRTDCGKYLDVRKVVSLCKKEYSSSQQLKLKVEDGP